VSPSMNTRDSSQTAMIPSLPGSGQRRTLTEKAFARPGSRSRGTSRRRLEMPPSACSSFLDETLDRSVPLEASARRGKESSDQSQRNLSPGVA